MSWFCWGHIEDKVEVFVQGGKQELGRQLNVPFLVAPPMGIALRNCGDAGIQLLRVQPTR